MNRLEQFGHVRTVRKEAASLGPVKSLFRATPAGQRAANARLDMPVDRPRDIRSDLLIKLVSCDRIGADPSEVLR